LYKKIYRNKSVNEWGNSMALEDLLGKTAEIRIIDFLATNYDNSYNQSEISDFTGISRNILYKKLPEMVEKKILVVDNIVGRFKSYHLANNSIVNKLIAMDIEYNLMMSEPQKSGRSIDKVDIEGPESPIENRYYQAPETDEDRLSARKIPISIQVSDAKDPDGFITLSESGAKKLYVTLKDTIGKQDESQASTSSR
jgi:hypothetical protein